MPWLAWTVGCIGLLRIEGSGIPGEVLRDLPLFSEVTNTTRVEVELTPPTDELASPEGLSFARVRCDDNLIELIETEVVGGTLRIHTPPGTWLRPTGLCLVQVVVAEPDQLTGLTSSGSGDTIALGEWPSLLELHSSGSGTLSALGTLPSLERIASSGSGGVEVEGIASASVLAHSSGSGAIRLAGEVDWAELDTSGSGGIRALELVSVDASIHSSGSGPVWLTATGSVEVHSSGSGDVHLAGDPRVDAHTSGSGRVRME